LPPVERKLFGIDEWRLTNCSTHGVHVTGFSKDLLPGYTQAPLVYRPQPDARQHDLSALIREYQKELHDELLKCGALLFRDFNIGSVDAFGNAVEALGKKKLDYVHRSTPRTAIGDRLFTATEYPASQEIQLHCENSYLKSWPHALAFCCLVPAETGGETPIANLHRVTSLIGSELVTKFESLGVRYVRHYRKHIDLPWQTVFQTDSKDELAQLCRAQGIDHQWLADGTLRTAYKAQGIAEHPVTGHRVFFNQAHLFHVSSVGEESARALIETFGRDRVPRHATFGDGSEISAAELEKVRNAFKESSIAFPWNAGDVLVLDNMQFAHGRRPFRGQRRVIAALLGD
jgi:alpha-ketoglutarate-dependent taurine dioxygenase